MSKTVIVGGSNYTVPDVGERSWGQNVTDLMIAMSTAITSGGGSGGISTQAISSSPVNVVSGKTYLVDTSAARTFNLPTPAANAYFAVRDVTGGAASNNVTVHRFAAESIDGVASDRVLNIANGYWIFVCDGTNWFSLVNYPIKFAQLDTSANEQLTMPGGSLGALPFRIGSSDSGLFNSGSGLVAVAAGQQICRFDSAAFLLIKNMDGGSNAVVGISRVEVGDGTAAAPSVTFGNSTNTGLFRVAVGTLGITAGGVERIRIENSMARMIFGGSTSLANMGGTLFVNTSVVGNIGTGEDDLVLTSIQPNSLNQNGRGIRFKAWGNKANNANAKTLRVYFGSALVGTLSLAVSAVGTWMVELQVFRTGANAQSYSCHIHEDAASSRSNGTLSQTDTSTIAVKCTGQATADNDITENTMIIETLN